MENESKARLFWTSCSSSALESCVIIKSGSVESSWELSLDSEETDGRATLLG